MQWWHNGSVHNRKNSSFISWTPGSALTPHWTAGLCWSVATIQIWRSPQDGPDSKGLPDKGLAHICMREPSHGEEDKRRNKRQTHSLVCFMYLLAGWPFLKFLSFKALPEAIRMSSVSNITLQEAGKEGDSSELWPWERNNLALWCRLLLLFFSFFFLKKTTDVWSLGPQDTF